MILRLKEVIKIGSITYINRNPKQWRAYDSGKKLKPEFGGEKLMVIYYGTFDDDPDGTCEMTMYMRESVYNNLMTGTYSVSPNSMHRLIILDENKHIVPSIGGHCY